ncbi:MAG: LAGLIDADG family homing endonuclease, partial [Candidatus Micrarchaeota archaeon]
LQELIIRSVAPSIYWHDEVKLAIALQLFGGNFGKSLPDGKKLRGEIHALLIGDPGCLIDDERVILGNGAIAKLGNLGKAHLEKINVPVLTGQGYTRDYAKVFHAYKQQPILEIITESGKCIKGTYNHPLLAVNGMKKEWKMLDELKVGNRLATITWIPCTITKPLELHWKKIERKFGPKFKAKLPKILDPELAGFLGYVQGDGWVTRTEIAMDVIPDEADLIPKLIGKIEKLFAIKPKIITEHRPGKKPINVIHIRSTDIAFNLQFLNEKRVPDLVLQSGNEVAAQYLSWLFEADGTVFSKGRGKRAVQLRTSKERVEFLRDVQILILRFGIHSRILANESLVIRRANSIKKFSDAIGFQSEKKKARMEKLVLDTAHLHHKLGNQLSERIVSIKKAGIADVYDVEIPKGHRFIANGIASHNTSKTTMLMYVKNLAPKC